MKLNSKYISKLWVTKQSGNGFPSYIFIKRAGQFFVVVGFLIIGLAFLMMLVESSVQSAAASVTRDGSGYQKAVLVASNPNEMFKQALADDMAGRHESARKLYEILRNTNLQKESAVPSAVNFAAMGRFSDAERAFGKLSKNANKRISSYAQLWKLWLIARTDTGAKKLLQKRLVANAKVLKLDSDSASAIADFYAGKISAESVFSKIDSAKFSDDATRRDARAEAAFFVGGYLQYVRKDRGAALKLYKRELPSAAASIELPLIKQSISAQ